MPMIIDGNKNQRVLLHNILEFILSWYCAVFIMCLPLYIVRFKIFGLPSTLVELLFWGFAIIFMAWFLSSGKPNFTNIKDSIQNDFAENYQLWVLIFVILLSAAIGVGIAVSTRSALGIFRAYFIEPILLFVILRYIAKHITIIKFIVIGVAGLIVWLCLLSCLQVFFHTFIFAPDEAHFNRATGVFTTANALGLLLGPAGALFLGFAVAVRHRYKLLAVAVTGITAVTIILSRSLTGLIGFGAAISVVVVLKTFFDNGNGQTFLKRLTIVAFAGLVALQLSFFAFVLPNLTPKVSGPDLPVDSLAIRYYLWEGSFRLLEGHPFGVGLSSFPKAYAPYRIYQDETLRKGFDILPLYPHNMLLNFWSEIGIVGTIALYLLCLTGLEKALMYKRYPIALGLIGAIVYLLIHGLTDVPYFKNDLAFMFWILLAVCFSLPKIAEETSK